jgi:hypothetical protein
MLKLPAKSWGFYPSQGEDNNEKYFENNDYMSDDSEK